VAGMSDEEARKYLSEIRRKEAEQWAAKTGRTDWEPSYMEISAAMKRKPLISPTYVKALREHSAYKSNRETSKAALSFCRGVMLAVGIILSISLLFMLVAADNGVDGIWWYILAGVVVLILLFIAWVALNNWFEKINMEFDNADNQFVISQLTYESMTQTLFEDSGLPDEPVR
jgi:hypothetical protein